MYDATYVNKNVKSILTSILWYTMEFNLAEKDNQLIKLKKNIFHHIITRTSYICKPECEKTILVAHNCILRERKQISQSIIDI